MSTLSWIIVGLIGGALGKLFHPGNDSNGLIRTMLLGILGGVIGNALSSKFLGWGMTGIDIRSVGISATGSLLLLLIYKRVFKKG